MGDIRGEIRIGISGWRYRGWRGVFYPPALPQRQELQYAAQHFATIELNGSFYSLQQPGSYARWHDETPPGFVFAVKGSRYITHLKRLRDLDHALPNFFASGLFHLRDKLGPFLWQFPPTMSYDAERFDAFFRQLPRDTAAAAALARHRDARLHGRSRLKAELDLPLRHAVEVRHPSFEDPAFVQQLREHRIALVVADTAGRWPYLEDLTADFVYLRLHGDQELYASGYSDAALDRWAARIRAWARGRQPRDARTVGAPPPLRRARDVYCYFDNDAKVQAPVDAERLMQRLGLRWTAKAA